MMPKLAFWPGDDLLVDLLAGSFSGTERKPFALAKPLPAGLLAVPRADGSMWVINTSASAKPLSLSASCHDRVTQRKVAEESELAPFEVVWLAKRA